MYVAFNFQINYYFKRRRYSFPCFSNIYDLLVLYTQKNIIWYNNNYVRKINERLMFLPCLLLEQYGSHNASSDGKHSVKARTVKEG